MPPTTLEELKAKAPVPVPVPEGMWVADDGTSRRIVRPWFERWMLYLLAGSLAWDCFVGWLGWSAVRQTPADPEDVGGRAKALIAVALLLFGLLVTYFALGGLLNRTVVEVGGGRLRVWRGPLPDVLSGNHDLDAAEVVGLVHEFDRPSCGVEGCERHPLTYRLTALLARGPAVALLRDIETEETARFYEWQLSAWLGLAAGKDKGG